MTDIDAELARLREMPVHPRLASIDAAVLADVAIQAAGSRPLSGTVFGMAAISALAIGIAGSALPGTPVRAASVAPFGAPPALAPSRSEEHTSELQSLMRSSYAVLCLKNKNNLTTAIQ